MEKGRIIEEHQLENGIELLLIDRSRVTVGNRWLVELQCEAHIRTDEGCWDLFGGEDPRLQGDIRKILGNRLVFRITKQRNFIDASQRETVLGEMVQQVHGSMLAYLNRPHFPQEFFKKQSRETRKKLLLQQAMNRRPDTC